MHILGVIVVSCPTNAKNIEWYILLTYFVLGSWFQHGCCKAYWEECKNLLTDVQYVSLHCIFCCLLEFPLNVKTSAVSIAKLFLINSRNLPCWWIRQRKKLPVLRMLGFNSLLRQSRFIFLGSSRTKIISFLN